jgi:hypothetical protein
VSDFGLSVFAANRLAYRVRCRAVCGLGTLTGSTNPAPTPAGKGFPDGFSFVARRSAPESLGCPILGPQLAQDQVNPLDRHTVVIVAQIIHDNTPATEGSLGNSDRRYHQISSGLNTWGKLTQWQDLP